LKTWGLAVSEEQIPQIVENNKSRTERIEQLEARGVQERCEMSVSKDAESGKGPGSRNIVPPLMTAEHLPTGLGRSLVASMHCTQSREQGVSFPPADLGSCPIESRGVIR
jgi:hypothetical protein